MQKKRVQNVIYPHNKLKRLSIFSEFIYEEKFTELKIDGLDSIDYVTSRTLSESESFILNSENFFWSKFRVVRFVFLTQFKLSISTVIVMNLLCNWTEHVWQLCPECGIWSLVVWCFLLHEAFENPKEESLSISIFFFFFFLLFLIYRYRYRERKN